MDDQLPDDGLKWFGEGFDGFPRRLPNDCIEYIIHVVDTKLETLSAKRSRLNEMLKAANDLKRQLLKDYIWQRDTFELSIHPKADLHNPTAARVPSVHQLQPYLRGRTDFGDSVADEWLIVYILRELSKIFSDAWIRVYDTDGEFLLIEAANSLPKWLNPDIAENRVWLNQGHIKIIALGEESASRNITSQAALSSIQSKSQDLLLDSAIEEEAFHRLREYPSAISSSLHHSFVAIPRKMAHILHRSPSYISPAIESFYLRDPVSLKPLASKDLSTLHFAPEDFVTVSVKFTKVGFAQLRSQPFDPPPAWTGIIPKMNDEKIAMGMKLTCGFEMLVADPQNQDKRVVRGMKLLLEDVENGEESLPSDQEMAAWPQMQDDEKWMDIDYNDFENELSGKTNADKDGFGDRNAQQNLRKMVSRFQDFLKDDDGGGVDGVGESDSEDEVKSENSGDGTETSQTEEQSKTEDVQFERALKETQSMPKSHIEESGLLDEARKLALQDDEDGSDVDEDEEMRKVIELMEKELKGHGALDIEGNKPSEGKGKAAVIAKKPFFGPDRPPHLQNEVGKKSVRFDDEVPDGTDDFANGELSSDDEEFNDVDLGLAKNMLESFKGQAGMAGPAGNLMKALGVNMPRDEDSE